MHRFAILLLLALGVPACGGATAIRSSGAGAGTTATLDDATITARVKTILLNDRQLDATKIDVSTTGGVVTMTGSVKSQADEARAVSLARQAPGVKDVRADLKIGT